MTKQINLLPRKVRQAQAAQRQISVAIMGVAVGLGVAGLLWSSLSLQVKFVETKVEQSRRNKTEVERQLADAQQQDLLNDGDLRSRVGQINTLSKTEVKWERAFQLVSAFTPQDTLLTSVSIAAGTESPVIRVVGESPSNLSFAVFVESLRKDDQLEITVEDVEVEGYAYDPTTGKVTFSLVITVPRSALDYSA